MNKFLYFGVPAFYGPENKNSGASPKLFGRREPKDWARLFRRNRETKVIMVNTFEYNESPMNGLSRSGRASRNGTAKRSGESENVRGDLNFERHEFKSFLMSMAK